MSIQQSCLILLSTRRLKITRFIAVHGFIECKKRIIRCRFYRLICQTSKSGKPARALKYQRHINVVNIVIVISIMSYEKEIKRNNNAPINVKPQGGGAGGGRPRGI